MFTQARIQASLRLPVQTHRRLLLLSLALLSGLAAADPVMDITRGGTYVDPLGGALPVEGLAAGVATPVRYRVANYGGAPLEVYAPVGLADLSNCTATVTTVPTVIAPGANANLVITVTPSTFGTWSVTVGVMANDSPDPYYWVMSGTAGSGAPVAALSINGSREGGTDIYPIRNGGSFSSPAVLPVGQSVDLHLNMENLGAFALNLSGMTVLAATGAEVTVQDPGARTVAPATLTEIVLGYTPTQAGSTSARLAFDTNDPGRNPYVVTFSVRAEGATCDVSRDGVPISGTDNYATTTT